VGLRRGGRVSRGEILLGSKQADTTFDTTQRATRRMRGQLRAMKSAQISGFCNVRRPLETGDGGL
jgi:hypothetical protein